MRARLPVVRVPEGAGNCEGLDRKLQTRINAAVERFASTGHGDVKKLRGSNEYRLTLRLTLRR